MLVIFQMIFLENVLAHEYYPMFSMMELKTTVNPQTLVVPSYAPTWPLCRGQNIERK